MNEFLLEHGLAVGGCLLVLVLVVATAVGLRFARQPWRRPGIRPPARSPGHPRLEGVGLPAGTPTVELRPPGMAIGREADNDLVVTADFPDWDTVSRHHARIYPQGADWVVEDLGSLNGVYVNDRRTGRNVLRDGWRLRLGGVEFVFRAGPGGTRR